MFHTISQRHVQYHDINRFWMFLDHHQLNVGRVDAMPSRGQVSYCTAGGCWKVPWRWGVVAVVDDLMQWQTVNNRGAQRAMTNFVPNDSDVQIFFSIYSH